MAQKPIDMRAPCGKPTEIVEENLLFVEGKDEELLFGELIKELRVHNVQVISFIGKSNLAGRLETLVKTSGFAKVRSLGIERDADADSKGTFQSIQSAIRQVNNKLGQHVNLPVPKSPFVPTGTNPKVTVIILPPGRNRGMLEDICLKAVKGDPAMECVNEYFRCLKRMKAGFPKNLSKAKVHVFLASRRKGDLRLGEAARAGYWPMDSAAFNKVKEFIRLVCLSKVV